MTDDEKKAEITKLRKQLKDTEKALRALEPSPLSMGRYENWAFPGIALALGLMGIFCASSAFCVAFLTNLFVLFFLAEVACRPGLNRNAMVALPHRSYSILMAGFLIAAVVSSFAHLYLQSGGVYIGCDKLTNAADAVYFSTVTLTTLGYGDYVPKTHAARNLVIWELGSGLLLLLLIVPVLASRLALLGEGHDEP